MKISIDSTLERLQEAELEKIKQQFLDEAFRGHPGDAELFEFEDIDRQCLVYPGGQFTIYGFFHYLGESFRIHATFYDGRKPWVSVITYSECYEFRSVRDAVSFCKQFRQTPDPGYAELQERCFKDIETPAWEIIKGQFAGLDPDDRVQMSVEGYQLSQHYTPQRFNTLHVEFEGTDDLQGTLTVTDLTGVVVLTRECHEPVTQLDVSHLTPGLYVVAFRNEKGVVVRKFVKM